MDNHALVRMYGPGSSLLLLRENLHRNVDFKLVTPRTWQALSSWYGAAPALPRTVIQVVRGDATPVPSATAQRVRDE
jgi:hypothetical protein